MQCVNNKRRKLLALGAAAATTAFIPLRSLAATKSKLSNSDVVWGGTGFNVPNDEINTRLNLISKSLDQMNQIGWKVWQDGLIASLTKAFSGEVIDNAPGMKLDYNSDPRPLFSVGFDYENFLRIDVDPGELVGEDSDGNKDICFYYLFSSIRIYTVQIPRQSAGKVSLVYSKPIKAFNRSLLANDPMSERGFVLDTLSGNADYTIISKFDVAADQIAFTESMYEPKHIRIRKVSFDSKAKEALQSLKQDMVFNENFFASLFGVGVNQAFEASVLPYVMTDYLSSTLSSRFDKELEMSRIFKDMDDDVAEIYLDLNITKVLRKISAENASKQQIARGLAIDVSFVRVSDDSKIFSTKLVRVEKREQVKGGKKEDWYRSNDSLYFYYLAEKMVDDFFAGVGQEDPKLLLNAGVRPQDASKTELNALKNALDSCRYGA